MSQKISIFIITYNEEKIIEQCLKKLIWADEIIVVDSKSSDNTVAICEKYGAKVFLKDFENYGKQKQFALNKTKNNWVLSLDADEVLSDELINEIQSLDLNNNIFQGYLIPRTHIFLNKIFRYGSENKKPILRFFDKTKGSFIENKVHETIVVNGKLGKLNSEMLHFTVFDFGNAVQKQTKYSLLGGEFLFEKNKKVSIFKVIIKFPFEFIRVYFFQRNFLNGYEGFIWSMLASYSSFIKYAKLFDLNYNKLL
jgi:glycosyltransferase involved in cell wall biosynthesis